MVKPSHIVTLCPKSLDLVQWLSAIEQAKSVASYYRGTLKVILTSNIVFSEFLPIHIVSLSSIISLAKQHDNKVVLQIADLELKVFVEENAQIHSYWTGDKLPNVTSPDNSVQNLWLVSSNMLDMYAYSISQYFARTFFVGMDVYAIQNSLIELYQNIFDHADATGNAFSYVAYDTNTQVVNIAVCDFGIGIAESMRRAGLVDDSDEDALLTAIQFGVSAQSKAHNGGFGLDNLVSVVGNGGEMKIVANRGVLDIRKGHHVETSVFPISFGGTLIALQIPVSQLNPLDEQEQDNFLL